MPFFAMSEPAGAFVKAAYDGGWILSRFSWAEWAGGSEAAAFRDDPHAVENANIPQLAKLLTALIRNDRFCEGALASAFDSGLLLRILRRIAELATPAQPQSIELPDPWFTLNVHDGVSLDLPGIYEWVIEGVGSYVGRYTRGSRPTRQYTQNVRNLLAGRGYRPGKETQFRRVHVALADAVRVGRDIELHILENPEPANIRARERELIAQRGTPNGTGRPMKGTDG